MLKALLFPAPLRSFPGQRWVRITLRTVHLLSMGLLMGEFAAGVPLQQLAGPFWWTLGSGLVFVAIELHSSCIFLLQLKGIAVLAKTLLFVFAWVEPERAMSCFVFSVIIGGVSSHMPGKYRYFSPLHGRVIKE